MSKKEQRKQLELAIIKVTKEVLNNQNASATQKIHKILEESSKVVAKKFYKAVKQISENGVALNEVKKPVVLLEKPAVAKLKIKTPPAKTKLKK